MTVRSPKGIDNIIIDPSNRLADAYMVNNSLNKNVSVEWEDFVWSYPDWKKYELSVRPKLWYNGYDGIKTGIRFTGDYMNYHHKLDATFWVNTGFNQIKEYLPEIGINYIVGESVFTEVAKTYNNYDRFSYQLKYHTALNKINQGLSVTTQSRKLDGLDLHSLGFKQLVNKGYDEVYLELKALNRTENEQSTYLLLPEEEFWVSNKWNNTITVGLKHMYTYFKGEGKIDLSLRSSTLGSDYQYAQLSLEVINKSKINKFNIKTRFFGQYATGTSMAPESKLFAAGANPEQFMENAYTRSTGFISRDWVNYSSDPNHFQMGGGLNLRAYTGYLMPEGDYENQVFTFSGTSGVAFSTELEFDQSLPIPNKLNITTYAFMDAGIINTNTIEQELALGSFRMDAGLGTSFNLFNNIDNVNPLELRVDFPWFMNRSPYAEDYFNFKRFIIGINRCF